MLNCSSSLDYIYFIFIYFAYFTAEKFQENLLKTMMAMEETYFSLADTCNRNCLVICDRGTMDAAACMY